MPLVKCPECDAEISDKAVVCPKCGYPLSSKANMLYVGRKFMWGYEWKTKSQIFGWPLVHIAIGRSKETGKLMGAKGIIAIGQFAVGLITIAQFGFGLLFGFGQFVASPMFVIAQFAVGGYFGLGQFAIGVTAVGQFAVGHYVRALVGFGNHVWSKHIKDPQAIGYFSNLWQSTKSLDFISVIKGILNL
ncbi:zinc-ribbon domain-containing protein [Candidatus Poribacteria bacterium]|nr:zinc-ribbon domain-containing protein [Candidatus Poribacteria bacterium]